MTDTELQAIVTFLSRVATRNEEINSRAIATAIERGEQEEALSDKSEELVFKTWAEQNERLYQAR